MDKEIMTMMSHRAKAFAAAGKEYVEFTCTDAALAAIPDSMPRQFAVVGTLDGIKRILPADEPSHPQRRQKHGQRPTEPLSFDDDAAPAASPVAPEQDQAKAEVLWIQLGQGKIEVGQGHHGYDDARLPAILFGRNGAGQVGIETEGDRTMQPGECIAAITFENPQSLDVVAEKMAELRARIWPGATPAAHIAPAEVLSEADILDALGTITEGTPKRLPPGWSKFARAIERKVAAHIASKPNADSAWKTYIAQRTGLMDTSSNRAIFVAGYSAAATPAASTPTVPEGYAIVPVEPTPEMQEAFNSKLKGDCGWFFQWPAGGNEGYRAMLAAAPVAPAASADAVIEAREQALEEAITECDMIALGIYDTKGSAGVFRCRDAIRALKSRPQAAGAEGAE